MTVQVLAAAAPLTSEGSQEGIVSMLDEDENKRFYEQRGLDEDEHDPYAFGGLYSG